jgi:CDK inhibitor PHO81
VFSLTPLKDPVFFASQCGKDGVTEAAGHLELGSAGDDQRTLSIGAAVEFAKSNNLLGIFVDADLLVSLEASYLPCLDCSLRTAFSLSIFCHGKIRVPSAIDGIRSSELIVGVLGNQETFSQRASADSEHVESHAVDAYFDKGIMTFVDRSLREMSL